MFGGFDLSQVVEYLYIGLFCTIGFSIRMIKKFITEHLHPIDYLRCFAARTFASWATITGTAIATYTATGDSNAITYITLAYMADSLINKTPSEEEVEDYKNAQAIRKAAKLTNQAAAKLNADVTPPVVVAVADPVVDTPTEAKP